MNKINSVYGQKLITLILILFSISCNDLKKEEEKSQLSTKYVDVKTLAFRANNFYQTGKYLDGKLSYDTLISIDSLKSGYYFKRGYCRMMLLDDDDAAIFDYLKSIKGNYSEKEKAYLNIGVIYRLRNNYDSALYFYEECLKVDPNNAQAIKEKKDVSNLLFFRN